MFTDQLKEGGGDEGEEEGADLRKLEGSGMQREDKRKGRKYKEDRMNRAEYINIKINKKLKKLEKDIKTKKR